MFYHNCCTLILWMLLYNPATNPTGDLQSHVVFRIEKTFCSCRWWLHDQYIFSSCCSQHPVLTVHNIHYVPIITLIISVIADSLSIIIRYNIVLLPISITIKYFMHNIHRNFPIFLGLLLMFWCSYYSRKYSNIFCISLEMRQIYQHNVGSNRMLKIKNII